MTTMIFTVSDLDQLRRFLVLGNGKVEKTVFERSNFPFLTKMIQEVPAQVVEEIVSFAQAGRAPKKDPLLFALALCATADRAETRRLAYQAMNQVCGIPTDLFDFIANCERLTQGGTGWGRIRRQAVADWYNGKSSRDLVYHATKYKQRNGWSHRDMLRLAHVKPQNNDHGLIYRFLTKGSLEFKADEVSDVQAFDRLVACDEVMRTENIDRAVELIEKFKLVHEHIPTERMKEPRIWEALLPHMPLKALVRNLGRMTALDMLGPNSSATIQVLDKLSNQDAIDNSRLHPLSVLIALVNYQSGGEGGLGKLRWTPNNQIVSALDELFHKTFAQVEPTGKRILVACDVSGSMSAPVSGARGIPCAMASSALALTLVMTEPYVTTMAFADSFKDLAIGRHERLGDLMRRTAGMNFGGTDCSLPARWARENRVPVDSFVLLTDSETNSKANPSEELIRYREAMGIDARLAVLNFSSASRTIGDPSDRNVLQLVGFDSATPQILREFMAGGF